jgi:transcriptional regulator with XRE-family HTH domain
MGDGTPAGERDERQLWREFGQELERLRGERGLSLRELERQAKVSYTQLYTLEQGGRNKGDVWVTPNPRDEQLGRIARALGVSPERFYKQVGRYDDRPRTKAGRSGEGLRLARESREWGDEVLEILRGLDDRLKRLEEAAGIDPEAEPDSKPPGRRRGRAS